MPDQIDKIRSEKITIHFDGKRCVHSRNCVLGNPEVFVPNAPGQWIHPEAAAVEEVVAIAAACAAFTARPWLWVIPIPLMTW